MSNNKPLNKVIAAGLGDSLLECRVNLAMALDLIEQMNFSMVHIITTLEPIADLDFHGKWRIHAAIEEMQYHSCPKQAQLTYDAITSQGAKNWQP